MNMKKESNVYALVYAVLLVVFVGISLSLVYQSLRGRQNKNEQVDTMSQILRAARVPIADGDVEQTYYKHVTDGFIVNYHGSVVNKDAQLAFEACINISNEFRNAPDKRQLPVLVCKTKEGYKYIVPVYGSGLWGPIWGYLALDEDCNKIYGAYFSHQGETPGLGAEIAKPAFYDQFEGKRLFGINGKFESVRVCKPGAEPKTGSYVYGVSGGTITSQGVAAMLKDSLEPYLQFFKSKVNNNRGDGK